MDRKITVLPSVEALLADAAESVVHAAKETLRTADTFSLALSGGNTPRGLYQLLASQAYRHRIDWGRVEIYFGDERCVPSDSEQSNFRMANETLLSKVPIRGGHVHRMRGEIDPNGAAREYGELLKQKFGDGGIDFVLLGMGDDGHTASLFPHTQALKETRHRCVANYVEKLSSWRITLSAPFINRAAAIAILVAGRDKAARVKEVLEGPSDPERLPIQMIQPESGVVLWLMDAAAAGIREDME